MSAKLRDLLDNVPIFLAVAEARSFTRAAHKLGISPSAASQAVRALEARLGTPLLMRSTRSLSLTAAGATYLDRAGPAFMALTDVTLETIGLSARPAGPLRLTMPRFAYDGIVGPALMAFRRSYPEVEVEIEVEGRLVDIVENGFDAGLRFGDLLAKDVTAVKVLPASESLLAASPAYLASHPAPPTPSDLLEHDTVVCRSRTTGIIQPWLLVAADLGVSCRIDPKAPAIVGDIATETDLIVRGHGISCLPSYCIDRLLQDGKLVRVLPGWSVPLEPIYIFYPSRRRQTPALRAFVEHLKQFGSTRKAIALSREPAVGRQRSRLRVADPALAD